MGSLIAAVPAPPVNFKASSFQDVFSIAQMVLCGVAFLFAFRELYRGRGPVFIWFLLGGFIACLWEPIVDVLGQCWLPTRGQHWEAFTLLGRHIPLMMPFVYSWFVGGQAYLFYRLFTRGTTRRRMFELWALVFLVNIALETPGILTNVYTYYGKQPFDIWGFPLWWGFVNPLMPMIAATLVFRLKPYMTAVPLAIATVLVVPSADGVANAFAAWPVIAALNTDVGYVGTWIGGCLTLVLAGFVVWIIGLVVTSPGAPIEAGTAVHVGAASVRSAAGNGAPPSPIEQPVPALNL
jgi:hypothetical protein